ncbi:hypothetical protein PybrP1_010576 [[Pythium] brassicae (nom. inval.)]|nr:hypothetical protein PybrP1_010576 [[Pythium] brassicae (nom. inval.)]
MTSALPKIHVTESEQLHYDVLATQLVNNALSRYSQFNGFIDTDDWRFVRRRRQMSVYRAIRGADVHSPFVTRMVGSGLINGSLEDVMDGLYNDTTDNLRTGKTLFHYKLLDAAVVHVSERRSTSEPFRFSGIKWVAAKAAWGFVKHRELLTYERSGTIHDPTGREFAYHTIQSIDRSEWPPNAVRGVKRATTSTCYLFQRLSDNHVEVFLWGEFLDANKISHRAAEYTVAGLWLKVVYSVDCAEAKRYSKMLPREGGADFQNSRDACHICFKSPGVFETPRHCASCQHSVCKTCSCSRATFAIDVRTGKPLARRFCKLCASKTIPTGNNKHDLKEMTGDSGLKLSKSLASGEAAVMAKEEDPWTTSKLGNFDLGVASEAVDASKGAERPEAELTSRRSSKFERLSQHISPTTRWQQRIESGLFD